MRERGLTRAIERKGDPSIVIFLGLYLLLLAFFMLLNSIANIDAERANDAVDSVGKAFSELRPPLLRGEEELIAQGAVLATDTFQGQVKAAMVSILRIAEVDSLGGEQMRIETSVKNLFDAEGETLREDSVVFMDRIARVMARDEQGKKREIEIILGVGAEMPPTVDAGSSQRLRQATLFANELIHREVAPSAISIGLSPGDDGNIVMFLTLRSVDDDASGATR